MPTATRADATRFVGLVDRVQDGAGLAAGRGRRVDLLADVDARADLFEGYSPTLLAVDAAGTVTRRHFVYPDTDVRALLLDLTGRRRGDAGTMSLNHIPTTSEAPVDARPSDVVARIRAYRPSRRAVLRGLLVGAAAATLVPIDWFLTRREAGAAPDDKSEHMGCTPESYDEEANNWWTGGPAVCYGGWRRGSYPCEGNYHREGAHSAHGEDYTSTRLTTNCHGRNAWRWKGYRCSDAMTLATFADGSEYNSITIAACVLANEPAAAPTGRREAPRRRPRAAATRPRATAPRRAPRSTEGPGSSDGDDEQDPASPRRPLVPSLGTGAGAAPGFGALIGR